MREVCEEEGTQPCRGTAWANKETTTQIKAPEEPPSTPSLINESTLGASHFKKERKEREKNTHLKCIYWIPHEDSHRAAGIKRRMRSVNFRSFLPGEGCRRAL